ncbi:MAG: hypothetical protein UW22_C0030G0001, partial [Candidatus Gottesmanbacteria bacterium GW2011_GWB1_44_11c]
PGTDNTYQLGNSTYRWKSVNVGPGSFNITSTTGTSGAGANYTLGQITFGSGSSLSFGTSAVGTGSTGSLALQTAGTDRLFITGGGNVGINSGGTVNTQFEVGGTASISSTLTTYGANTFSGTGSSSFAGSLSVAKGFLAGANNALVVNANATANTLNIVGGNVGIGTTFSGWFCVH